MIAHLSCARDARRISRPTPGFSAVVALAAAAAIGGFRTNAAAAPPVAVPTIAAETPINQNILTAITEATEAGAGLIGLVADAVAMGRPETLDAVTAALQTAEDLPVRIVLAALRTMPIGGDDEPAQGRLLDALVESAVTSSAELLDDHAKALARQPTAMAGVRTIAASRASSPEAFRRRARAIELLALNPDRTNVTVLANILAGSDPEDEAARRAVRPVVARLIARPEADDVTLVRETRSRLALGELGWWAAIREADADRLAALARSRAALSARLAEKLGAPYTDFAVGVATDDEKEALSLHLADAEASVRRMALAHVVRRARDQVVFEEPIPELIWGLVVSPEPDIAREAMKALDEFGVADLGDTLARSFSSEWPPDVPTTAAALQIIGRTGTHDAVPLIQAWLESTNPTVRAETARAVFAIAGRGPLPDESTRSILETMATRLPAAPPIAASGVATPDGPAAATAATIDGADAPLARLLVRLVPDADLVRYTAWLTPTMPASVVRGVAEAFAARQTFGPLIERADMGPVRLVLVPALGRSADSPDEVAALQALSPADDDDASMTAWRAAVDQLFSRLTVIELDAMGQLMRSDPTVWTIAQQERLLVTALEAHPNDPSRALLVRQLLEIRVSANDFAGAADVLATVDPADQTADGLRPLALRTRLLTGDFEAASALEASPAEWLAILNDPATIADTDADGALQRRAIADVMLVHFGDDLSAEDRDVVASLASDGAGPDRLRAPGSTTSGG